MLNYIWVGLIAIGILVAVGSDINDQVQDTYRNGQALEVAVRFTPAQSHQSRICDIIIPTSRLSEFYRLSLKSLQDTTLIVQPALVTLSDDGSGTGTFQLLISENSPLWWQKMAKDAGTKNRLNGKILIHSRADEKPRAALVFEPVTLVRIRAVTQAVLEYASIAVTIALGLIGIMALWLGIMKIAEAAGLVGLITRGLSPVMTRLFPDVPREHPAMAAMVMNIAANVLGLSNAATPFGLKAMDELDKLNRKKGTATNAMVTFLAINTAGLTLIPATAIAIRAGIGSANPAVIIGTSIFGASCATIVGIATAKLLQRLPVFRKSLEPTEEEKKEVNSTEVGDERGTGR
jgi:spore maturation protein A